MKRIEAYLPIDVVATASQLPHQGSLLPVEVMTEVAGQAGGPQADDERSLYVPFADLLGLDPSKREIVEVLGRMGAIAIDLDGFADLTGTEQVRFAAGMALCDQLLESRSRVLSTSGLEGSALLASYGTHANEEWAKWYGLELRLLRDVLRSTKVFKAADALRNEPAVRRITTRVPQTHDIRVLTTTEPNLPEFAVVLDEREPIAPKRSSAVAA